MKAVVFQYLNKLDPTQYRLLKDQFDLARALYNRAIFVFRKAYFDYKEILQFLDCCIMLKETDEYKSLHSNVAQYVLLDARYAFCVFSDTLKRIDTSRYNYHNLILPGYLDQDAYIPLVIKQMRLTEDHKLIFPLSRKYKNTLRFPSLPKKYKKKIRPLTIPIPPVLYDQEVVRAIVSYSSKLDLFKIAYEYEVEVSSRDLDRQHVMAIDLGINNMAACVTNRGESFIINGRRLKARAQWFNTQYFRLKEIAEKNSEQGRIKQKTMTKQMRHLWKKFHFQINDEYSKAARYIINYCLENDIGTLVVGKHNPSEIFRSNPVFLETNFVPIPIGRLLHKIENLCKQYQIEFVPVDESYTSSASFFDGDDIPSYNPNHPVSHPFSGKRISSGSYLTKNGKIIHADVNAALNIMKKSGVVDVSPLIKKGQVKIPKSILLP